MLDYLEPVSLFLIYCISAIAIITSERRKKMSLIIVMDKSTEKEKMSLYKT